MRWSSEKEVDKRERRAFMIKIKTTGDFKNTERFFEKSKKISPYL